MRRKGWVFLFLIGLALITGVIGQKRFKKRVIVQADKSNSHSAFKSSAPQRGLSAVAATPETAVSPSVGQSRSAAVPSNSIEEYLSAHHPGYWSYQMDEDGRVKSIMGGVIPELGKNRASVIPLAQKLAEQLGFPPEQLGVSQVRETSTGRSTGFECPQVVQGYRVFGSVLSIFSRKSDGAVFLINNDLKVVDLIETEALISVDEAKRILFERFSNKNIEEIELESPDRVIWAGTRPHELAWSFIVSVSGPKIERLRVLVGIRSGEILFQQNLIRY